MIRTNEKKVRLDLLDVVVAGPRRRLRDEQVMNRLRIGQEWSRDAFMTPPGMDTRCVLSTWSWWVIWPRRDLYNHTLVDEPARLELRRLMTGSEIGPCECVESWRIGFSVLGNYIILLYDRGMCVTFFQLWCRSLKFLSRSELFEIAQQTFANRKNSPSSTACQTPLTKNHLPIETMTSSCNETIQNESSSKMMALCYSSTKCGSHSWVPEANLNFHYISHYGSSAPDVLTQLNMFNSFVYCFVCVLVV